MHVEFVEQTGLHPIDPVKAFLKTIKGSAEQRHSDPMGRMLLGAESISTALRRDACKTAQTIFKSLTVMMTVTIAQTSPPFIPRA